MKIITENCDMTFMTMSMIHLDDTFTKKRID
jgi:hypothetical protein